MNLYKHLLSQIEWSKKTFGPMRLQGVIDHLEKEMEEVKANPNDLEEWVDIVLLGLDGAWRSGHSAEQIIHGIKTKFAKNKNRTWPDWRYQDPTKAIEHIKLGGRPLHEYSHIEVSLREKIVLVFYRMAPAEPDVGIPTDFVDEFYLTDLARLPLNWHLTDEEEEYVVEKIHDYEKSRPEPEPQYDTINERNT